MNAGRVLVVGIVVLRLAPAAMAECPSSDCVGGGKIPATDCLVEFAGIGAPDEACTDGNPSCDMDGVVNGVCTFPLSACVNVAGDPRCTVRLSGPPVVRPARSPVAQALARALAALDPAQAGCTVPGLGVPLTAGLNGVRQSVARLAITASAGSQRDRNKLRLTCRPSPAAPSLSQVILPIFAARCALPACHAGSPGSAGPVLEGPGVHDALVGVPALNVPSLSLVRPGSVAQSYLARKVLGKRIVDRTPRMPQGCPKTVPAGGCLTDGEIAAMLAWIQTGAPDN